MPPLSSNSSQQCYRSCKGERTVPHFPLTRSRSQVPVKESWAHSFNSSVMETFKAAGNYVRLPVTVLPVSAPLHTTPSLCAAQREVHIEIEFRRELVEKKKKSIPSNYGEDEINIFLVVCVSGERCLNRISIKQDAFIIPQKQIEMIVGLRFKFRAAILYSFFRCSFFTSIWHLKNFCFPITWPICICWNPEMSFFYTFLIQFNFVMKQKKLSQTLKISNYLSN